MAAQTFQPAHVGILLRALVQALAIRYVEPVDTGRADVHVLILHGPLLIVLIYG